MKHKRAAEGCPATDPQLGAVLLQNLSAPDRPSWLAAPAAMVLRPGAGIGYWVRRSEELVGPAGEGSSGVHGA